MARISVVLVAAGLALSVMLSPVACTALKSGDDRPPPAGDDAADADAQPFLDASEGCPAITEFSLPGDAGKFPSGIIEGPDGNLWFTLQFTANYVPGARSLYGDAIGWMSPDGTPHELAVPTHQAGPYAMAPGPDGNPWFTEFASGNVGRILVDAGPRVTEFPTPAGAPNGIAAGPDGSVWFTDLDGNDVDWMGEDGGDVTQLSIPQPSTQPRGIVLGPDGNVWFGQQAGLVGRVTPGGQFQEFAVQTGNPSVGAIVVGQDGNLWFTDGGNQAIGRITTEGVITEYAIPTPGSNPFALAAAPDGALWFTESGSNKIGRLTLGTTGLPSFLECPVPTPRSNPLGIAVTSSAVWFTESFGNKIGRVALP